jgi:S-adenosylmethionine synthetase
MPERWITPSTRFLVNPSGSFVNGGPAADTGLTGRKIVVDGYGGAAPVGGGAFSGKDPTKVDRTGAYAARWLAKNVVAAGIAERCLVEIAYAIGRAEPVAVQVDTFDSGVEDPWNVARAIERTVSLTPAALRERLGLARPIYVPTSSYGHFGRRADKSRGTFMWERLDLVEALLTNLG